MKNYMCVFYHDENGDDTMDIYDVNELDTIYYRDGKTLKEIDAELEKLNLKQTYKGVTENGKRKIIDDHMFYTVRKKNEDFGVIYDTYNTSIQFADELTDFSDLI